MITFKQQITVPEELVEGLAVFLGYDSQIDKETAEEYVDRLAKDHTANFFKAFGDKLVQDTLKKLGADEQKKQVEEQIIKPIQDALSSTVIKTK